VLVLKYCLILNISIEQLTLHCTTSLSGRNATSCLIAHTCIRLLLYWLTFCDANCSQMTELHDYFRAAI